MNQYNTSEWPALPPYHLLTDSLNDYQQFLSTKLAIPKPVGIEVSPEKINPKLFSFQRDIVRWALHLGRAAIFADVGLGKTGMQLEWANHVAQHTDGCVLILAPLAVAEQTVREGQKFGIVVRHVRDQSELTSEHAAGTRIFITNYERVEIFDIALFSGIVLDESSILKHYSKTFFDLCERFKQTPYRLCCTATPSPNDIVEIGNHSTFLDIMDFHDVLARWFVGEGDVARQARLKGHAVEDFYRWLTSWAVCISKPADLGEEYDMPGYERIRPVFHEYELASSQQTIERAWEKGKLLPDTPSATSFMQVKRDSNAERVAKVKEIVDSINHKDAVIIWCDTDFEADLLKQTFPEAVEVRGSQSPKVKEEGLNAFSNMGKRIIITKPIIAGMGLNWQHCSQMIFTGVSFSFEQTYQAMGRIVRYGQTRTPHIHMIYSESEGSVMQRLQEKQRAFADMQQQMNAAMRKYGLFRTGSGVVTFSETENDKAEGDGWTMYLGDCVQVASKFEANSIDFSVHSPPFASLYTYSDKQADMGNAATEEEFFAHYTYVIKELLRVTKPGRAAALHVKDLPLFINRDTVMGINPFSDNVTNAFRNARLDSEAKLSESEKSKWVLQSRITVGKDPVIEMQKTNSHGLLYKNWRTKAQALRVGLPDYVLVFRKFSPLSESAPVMHDPHDLTYHGDNPPAALLAIPSKKTGQINASLPVWQSYANPIWDDVTIPAIWSDINQMNVLNTQIARDAKDERHLAPLQLDLIARLIHWYTNPGELVFDPFGGVGSTVYEAVKSGRRGVASELKPAYWRLACKYIRQAELEKSQPMLFDMAEEA